MWVCSKCGCSNEDDNKFCSDCGLPYAEAAETIIEKISEPEAVKEIGTAAAGGVDVAAAAAASQAKAAKEAEQQRQEQLMKEAAKEQEEAAKKARKAAEKEVKKAEKKARKAEEKAALAREAAYGPGPGGPGGMEPPREKSVGIAQRILGPLSIIAGLIGLFSGGYAVILSFLNFTTALIFFVPSVLAILFGVICLIIGVKRKTKKVQALAVIGLILGLLGLVVWVVIMMILRGRVISLTGGTELMDVLKMLINR